MQGSKFYLCTHCGNQVGMIHESGVPLICCGEPMQHMQARTQDVGAEKHVPFVTQTENTVSVRVGSTEHPSEADHYIEWIYLQTANGGQRKELTPGDKPAAVFALADDQPLAVYAYCNKHGLWVEELGKK